MMQAISGAMAEGPGVWATLDLPSGPAEITSEDYRRAQSLLVKERQIMGRRSPEVDTEEVLAYATLIKFADEFDHTVKALSKFLDTSNQHASFLIKKAGHVEEYLKQR